MKYVKNDHGVPEKTLLCILNYHLSAWIKKYGEMKSI